MNPVIGTCQVGVTEGDDLASIAALAKQILASYFNTPKNPSYMVNSVHINCVFNSMGFPINRSQ